MEPVPEGLTSRETRLVERKMTLNTLPEDTTQPVDPDKEDAALAAAQQAEQAAQADTGAGDVALGAALTVDDVRLLCCPSSCAPKAARYETTAAHMDAEAARRQAECDGPDGAVSGEGGSSGETEGDEPQTQQPL